MKYTRLRRKKDIIKKHILETAIRLFLENGYSNTTIDNIADAADIARGTFFNYFPRKYSIIQYYLENRRTILRSFCIKKFFMRKTAGEQLIFLMEALAKMNEDNKEQSKLIITEWVNEGGPLEISDTQAIFDEIIQKGQQSGQFNPEIEREVLAQLIRGIYFESLFDWVREGCSFSLKENLMNKLGIILRAIESNPGN